MVRTSPFHGGNMGSNPVGITNTSGRYKKLPFFFISQAFQQVRKSYFRKWRFGKFFRTRLCKFLYFSACYTSSHLVRSLGYFFIINQIRSQLTRKVLDLDDKLFFIQPLQILAEVISFEPPYPARHSGTLRSGYAYPTAHMG